MLAAGIMPGIPPRVANETGTLLANQDGVVLLLQPVNARHPSATALPSHYQYPMHERQDAPTSETSSVRTGRASKKGAVVITTRNNSHETCSSTLPPQPRMT